MRHSGEVGNGVGAQPCGKGGATRWSGSTEGDNEVKGILFLKLLWKEGFDVTACIKVSSSETSFYSQSSREQVINGEIRKIYPERCKERPAVTGESRRAISIWIRRWPQEESATHSNFYEAVLVRNCLRQWQQRTLYPKARKGLRFKYKPQEWHYISSGRKENKQHRVWEKPRSMLCRYCYLLGRAEHLQWDLCETAL